MGGGFNTEGRIRIKVVKELGIYFIHYRWVGGGGYRSCTVEEGPDGSPQYEVDL